jgi:hypothetical protein
MWNYSDVPRDEEERDAEDRLPGGKHYLIITGYDDVTDKFRVWDPWLGHGSIPNKPEVHQYYISYEGYSDPQVSLGMPITAMHEEDYYNLRRFVVDAPQLTAPDGDLDQDEPEQVVLVAAGFDEILHLSHEIQAHARDRVVYAYDGSIVPGPKRAGEAFPVVGLSTRKIVESDGAAHRLLTQQAWALIAPIVTGPEDRLVDSLQMYRTPNGWKPGGHTNTLIAQLTVKAAERLRKEFGAQQRVYLVSIPEQIMFFAAFGEGAAAKLISLDNDANGPILDAREALAGVVKYINQQRMNLKKRRPRTSPRPR